MRRVGRGRGGGLGKGSGGLGTRRENKIEGEEIKGGGGGV